MLMASLGFIAMLVVPALDYRYSWSSTPTYVVLSGDVLTTCAALTIDLRITALSRARSSRGENVLGT